MVRDQRIHELELRITEAECNRSGLARLWYCVVCTRCNLWLLTLAVFFWIESDFECRLYDAFVAEALRPGMNELERVAALMEHTRRVVKHRSQLVSSSDAKSFRSVKRTWFHSGDLQLLEGNFGCGSYAAVFVEACHRAGVEAKLCQLRTGGQTIHILAEAYVNGRWVAVDPLFGQLFYDRKGQPVGLREVVANWAYHRDHSPTSYRNLGHDPDGVVYTNWRRSPLLSAAKCILEWTAGRQFTESFSLRSYTLNTYRVDLVITILIFAGYNLIRMYLARRRCRSGFLIRYSDVPRSPKTNQVKPLKA